LFNRAAKNLGIANKATKWLDFVHPHSEKFWNKPSQGFWILYWDLGTEKLKLIVFGSPAAQGKFFELRTKNLKWSGSCSTAQRFLLIGEQSNTTENFANCEQSKLRPDHRTASCAIEPHNSDVRSVHRAASCAIGSRLAM
jgi:hypothetical protein